MWRSAWNQRQGWAWSCWDGRCRLRKPGSSRHCQCWHCTWEERDGERWWRKVPWEGPYQCSPVEALEDGQRDVLGQVLDLLQVPSEGVKQHPEMLQGWDGSSYSICPCPSSSSYRSTGLMGTREMGLHQTPGRAHASLWMSHGCGSTGGWTGGTRGPPWGDCVTVKVLKPRAGAEA